jgi:hypothetical protein
MSDDFGTISVGRGDRSREIEAVREKHRQQRQTLQELMADAPNDQVASAYRRAIAEIDSSIAKLDELDPAAPNTKSPAMRPLVTTNVPDTDLAEPRSRLPLIILAAVIALALIGALLWYASSDRTKPNDSVIVEDTAATATTASSNDTAPPETGTVVPVATGFTVSPQVHDYGVIRKGTRATRQFEVTNNSDQPVTMVIARSSCKCLYYEYQATIAPNGKESVTVTIDGAKAKAGEVRETIKVSAKSDPSVTATFGVIATVQ